jgi:hypothetical protein
MLENTGDGPMVMMGNRSGNQDNIKHINYDTREDLRAGGEPAIPFHKAFDDEGAPKA